MPKKTRVSISVKGLTYQRLKRYCDDRGKSVSGYLEEVIAERLDAAGAPQETVLEPRTKTKRTREEIAGQHFTF